jgi:hypothetical protein
MDAVEWQDAPIEAVVSTVALGEFTAEVWHIPSMPDRPAVLATKLSPRYTTGSTAACGNPSIERTPNDADDSIPSGSPSGICCELCDGQAIQKASGKSAGTSAKAPKAPFRFIISEKGYKEGIVYADSKEEAQKLIEGWYDSRDIDIDPFVEEWEVTIDDDIEDKDLDIYYCTLPRMNKPDGTPCLRPEECLR